MIYITSNSGTYEEIWNQEQGKISISSSGEWSIREHKQGTGKNSYKYYSEPSLRHCGHIKQNGKAQQDFHHTSLSMGNPLYFQWNSKLRRSRQPLKQVWIFQKPKNTDWNSEMNWMKFDQQLSRILLQFSSSKLNGTTNLLIKRCFKEEFGHRSMILGSKILKENFAPYGWDHMKLTRCSITELLELQQLIRHTLLYL